MSKWCKHIALCMLVVSISGPAKADIEPINIIVKKAVAAVEEGKKQYLDLKEQYNKAKSAVMTGRDKVKKLANGIKDFTEDPIGVLKTHLPKGVENKGPEEPDIDRAERTKETYSRTKGAFDNIAIQKQLNKQINAEKFKGVSVLFARSIAKRQELRDEKTEEPDLSTLAAAQSAAAQKFIQSSKRWSSILQTQAYITSFAYAIEMQNYQNDPEEGDGQNE